MDDRFVEEVKDRVEADQQGKDNWSKKKEKILILHLKGRKLSEIAKETGLNSLGHISDIINSDEFKKRKTVYTKTAVEKVQERFGEYAEKAGRKLIDLAEKGTNKDRIKFEAVKEILHQIGCKPVNVVETRKRDYSPEEIQSAMVVMREIESISKRLATRKSKFILKKDEEVHKLPTREDEDISLNVESTEPSSPD